MRCTAERSPPLTATTRTVERTVSDTTAPPVAGFGVTVRVTVLLDVTVVTRSVAGWCGSSPARVRRTVNPFRAVEGPLTEGYAGTVTATGAHADSATSLNARTFATVGPASRPDTTALVAPAGTTTRLSPMRTAYCVSGAPPVSAGGVHVSVTCPRPDGVAVTPVGGCGATAAV